PPDHNDGSGTCEDTDEKQRVTPGHEPRSVPAGKRESSREGVSPLSPAFGEASLPSPGAFQIK
ncbi:MAG: hypothetical protein ABI222_00295, partial [Opitutaceae bacterium]